MTDGQAPSQCPKASAHPVDGIDAPTKATEQNKVCETFD